jgi:hypothetical protein
MSRVIQINRNPERLKHLPTQLTLLILLLAVPESERPATPYRLDGSGWQLRGDRLSVAGSVLATSVLAGAVVGTKDRLCWAQVDPKDPGWTRLFCRFSGRTIGLGRGLALRPLELTNERLKVARSRAGRLTVEWIKLP